MKTSEIDSDGQDFVRMTERQLCATEAARKTDIFLCKYRSCRSIVLDQTYRSISAIETLKVSCFSTRIYIRLDLKVRFCVKLQTWRPLLEFPLYPHSKVYIRGFHILVILPNKSVHIVHVWILLPLSSNFQSHSSPYNQNETNYRRVYRWGSNPRSRYVALCFTIELW